MTPSERVPYSLHLMSQNSMTLYDQHRKLLSMLEGPLMQNILIYSRACYLVVLALTVNI